MVLPVAGCIVLARHGGEDQVVTAFGLVVGLLGCALLIGAVVPLMMRRADMPTAICIYNALVGLAIGLQGFAVQSPTLMTAGLIVGTRRALMTLFPLIYRTGTAANTACNRSIFLDRRRMHVLDLN